MQTLETMETELVAIEAQEKEYRKLFLLDDNIDEVEQEKLDKIAETIALAKAKIIEKKQAESPLPIVEIGKTPAELIEAIKAIGRVLVNISLENAPLILAKAQKGLTEIKTKKDNLKRKNKQEEVNKEWNTLLPLLEEEATKIYSKALLVIEKKLSETKNYTAVAKAIEQVITLTEDSHQIIAAILEKPISNADWEQLKAKIAYKNKHDLLQDLNEKATIKWYLKLNHTKTISNFKTDASAIKEIERYSHNLFRKKTKDVTEINDFRETITEAVQSKKTRHTLYNCLFKDVETEEANHFYHTLPIVFKKVKKDNVTGWIIDEQKTKAPAAQGSNRAAELGVKSTIKIKTGLKNGSFISILNYKLEISRNKFSHEDFKIKKFLKMYLADIQTKINECNPDLILTDNPSNGQTDIKATEISKVDFRNQLEEGLNIENNLLKTFCKIEVSEAKTTCEWKFGLQSGKELKLSTASSSDKSLFPLDGFGHHSYYAYFKQASLDFEQEAQKTLT